HPPPIKQLLSAELDPLDLVIRKTSARRREVAPLEIENLVAVNHAVPLRTAAIPIPESRVREAVRSPPSQLVQDFAGRPRHSGTESTQGISTSRHKDHIGQADSDVPWNTRRACGPSWTARRRIKATPSQSARKASVTRGSSCRTRASAAKMS